MATAREPVSRREKWDSKRYPFNIHELESEFQSKIDSYVQTASMHDVLKSHPKAKSSIPINELNRKAQLHYENVTKGRTQPAIKGKPLDFRDCLLLELIFWFKSCFFTWFDTPNCPICNNQQVLTHKTGTSPLSEEITWGGHRVELYECRQCSTETRFPRYNHPLKLLDTRTGRCGEWANCFTLICKVMNFEARFVVDWTDHVWTEVYSESQLRWLHCDPCENICDAPLLYEVGWGKKLSYILAFSSHDIQDVTWRYTANHKDVLTRRFQCRENWLIQRIMSTRRQLQSSLNPERQKDLETRMILELVEMMSPKTVQENEKFGRISGSLDWRKERGEIGSDAPFQPIVYRLSTEEAFNKVFQLKYNVATDRYVRTSSQNLEQEGWQSGVFEQAGLFRKVEPDWKMVYIARTEGTDAGEISWKMDCTNTTLKVTSVTIKTSHATFENGKVRWKICNGDFCRDIVAGEEPYHTSEFNGSQHIIVSAHLSGGKGCNAWQHAQLFRQSINDKNLFPFELNINFE